MIETLQVAPAAEDLLTRKRAEGDAIGAAYYAGQVRGVIDVTLPEYRRAWPADASYASSRRAKTAAQSELEAHEPEFYGPAAEAYAQEVMETGPLYTEQMLADLMHEPTNTAAGKLGARSMLREFVGHKRRMQAIIAEQRVGWSAIVNNRFVACPPNGDVIFGHTPRPEELDEFLRANGYTAMPVDNPYSQPIIEILAKRAGVAPDEIRARGAARQAKQDKAPVAAALDATRVEHLDRTLVDDRLPASAIDATCILEPVNAEIEPRPATAMTPFAFAAAVGRIVNTNLYPGAADAIRVTTHHIITGGNIHTGFANYTAAERSALDAALQDIARRPVLSEEARALQLEAQDALGVLAIIHVA